MLTAHRDASTLAYFVSIVAVLTEEPIQQPSRTTVKTRDEEKVIICSNCESEVATHRCLHPGCPCNQANCGLCDRVFHKAVAKRSHVRVPLPASSACLKRSLSMLLHTPGAGSGAVDLISPIHGISTHAAQDDSTNEQKHKPLFSCSIIALILASIRAIMDDRRIRMVEIPGAMLSPIIASYIKFYTGFIECGGKYISFSLGS